MLKAIFNSYNKLYYIILYRKLLACAERLAPVSLEIRFVIEEAA